VESSFPAELNQLFKGMENKGNPWNMSPTARMEWAQGLDFDVKIVGEDVESLDEVEWLFWVGCAGAYEDRQKKTTRAVAELLHMADVPFAVLGNGETCNGDQARRAGNEFVFQGLAQQNVETFKEYKVKKVVSTCAHCFNTLKNEYKDFGIELEVVHHTQLLNRLVREGRLTPVADGAGAHKRTITYHDPCYIGRHNGVYSPPRELLQVLPGADFVEMPRNQERSFCCGAGGARMWMEENIGERINVARTTEAVATGADQIAVGCPFCRVMLSDGLTAAIDKGEAREEVEVLDVAQMLLASVKGEMATRQVPGAASAAPAAAGAGTATALQERTVETKAEPEEGDATITDNTVTETADAGPAAKASGGFSLFDTPADDAAEEGDKPGTASAEESPKEEAKAAKPTSSGGSLFDVGGDSGENAPAARFEPDEAEGGPREAEPTAELGRGGSLFDVEGAEAPESAAEPESQPAPAEKREENRAGKPSRPAAETIPAGASLFDVEPDADAQPAARPGKQQEESSPPAAETIPAGASLFDVQPDEPALEKEAEAEATPLEPVETSTATSPGQAETIPAGTSLFDIAAPDAVTVEPGPEPETEPEAEREAEPEPDVTAAPDEVSGGAAVSQAATAAASADERASDDEPEPEPETKRETKPTAPAGDAHPPKTDVDINKPGSLFDL
jgi:Fe-S oxidoreductase